MLIWWTTNTMFFYITIPCTRKYTNDRNEHLLCRVSQEALTLMALDMSLLCLCNFVLRCLLQDCCPPFLAGPSM